MWKAKLNDGREVSELNAQWENVKKNIVELLLITPANQIIILPKNMEEYIQFKTASAELGNSKNVQIESRVIGFVQNGTKIVLRVNEKNNNITVEANQII